MATKKPASKKASSSKKTTSKSSNSVSPKRRGFNAGLVYTLISAIAIIAGTWFAIQYAQGNFRVTKQGFMRESGLLSANSFPTGAEVSINGNLVTATDDTLYLEPGEYQIQILKDGYWPWTKNLDIESELVTQTNARLFPIAPSLVPLTFTGVDRVAPSPDGQKLLFVTSTATSNDKNGLYVLELASNFLSSQRSPKQLAEFPSSFDLTEAHFIWSPDSSEIMIIHPDREVLIEADRNYNLDSQPDIRFQRRQILTEWEHEMYVRERQFLGEFPEEIVQAATQSARNTYISPDKKRLLYTASTSTTLPTDLVPAVPAPNRQPQTRDLEENMVYIYDREEDTNFNLGQQSGENTPFKYSLATDLFENQAMKLEASPSAFTTLQASTSAQTAEQFNRYHTALYLDSFQWFPDSKHVIYTTESSIQVKSYDNTNDVSVYSGPFEASFVYPWPDGSKLLILTRFNADSPLNLYAIELD